VPHCPRMPAGRWPARYRCCRMRHPISPGRPWSSTVCLCRASRSWPPHAQLERVARGRRSTSRRGCCWLAAIRRLEDSGGVASHTGPATRKDEGARGSAPGARLVVGVCRTHDRRRAGSTFYRQAQQRQGSRLRSTARLEVVSTYVSTRMPSDGDRSTWPPRYAARSICPDPTRSENMLPCRDRRSPPGRRSRSL
jgi:hypothetical protein